jgi:4-hydroxybenzoate polyprenyltransferase
VKRVPVLDIIALASLYTIRILAGSLATGVFTSSWLFTLAMFFFLSLALVKRTSELQRLRAGAAQAAFGRGYTTRDLEVLSLIGVGSSLVAVLVLALYLNSPDVARFYARHERLWLICPLALYWVSRLWLLAHRGQVDEDPIVFALRDRTSYLVGALATTILYVGS